MSTVSVLAIQSYGIDFKKPKDAAGSKARIHAACDYMQQGVIPQEVDLVFPQGFQKWSPRKRRRPDSESLGKSMARYTKLQPEMAFAHTIQKPLSWTTLGDMLASYALVHRAHGICQAHFYFVTDPSHMRRVKLIWRLTHPEGWTASFLPANNHRRTIWERLIYEPLSLVKNLAMLGLLYYRYRGKPTLIEMSCAYL